MKCVGWSCCYHSSVRGSIYSRCRAMNWSNDGRRFWDSDTMEYLCVFDQRIWDLLSDYACRMRMQECIDNVRSSPVIDFRRPYPSVVESMAYSRIRRFTKYERMMVRRTNPSSYFVHIPTKIQYGIKTILLYVFPHRGFVGTTIYTISFRINYSKNRETLCSWRFQNSRTMKAFYYVSS